jgi:hypothetical protein
MNYPFWHGFSRVMDISKVICYWVDPWGFLDITDLAYEIIAAAAIV